MTFFRIIPAVLLWLLAPLASAQEPDNFLSAYTLTERPQYLWQFPKQFKEISGLALSDDGRLFGHAEKRAVIYQINWRDGSIEKTFTFGNPALKGDFEGMAIAGTRFYLISEKGVLYEGREGRGGAHKLFNTFYPEVGKLCKAGGLTALPTQGKLLILCLKGKKNPYKGHLTIFSWDIATRETDQEPFLTIDLGDPSIPKEIRKAEFTALEVLPGGSGLLVLAANQRLLIEIGFDGEIRGWRPLDKNYHKKAEGLAITTGGDLIIADESSPVQVSVYPPKADNSGNAPGN